MKSLRSFWTAALVGVIVIGGGARAAAQGLYTELAVAPSTGANGDQSAIAYDDKHDVYLQVYQVTASGAYDVYGRFVGANGAALGSPFRISTNRLQNGLLPRVAYSRGSGVDEFFVTYLADQTIPGLGRIFGQRVQYTGAAPYGGGLVGASIPVSPYGTQAAASNYDWSSDVVYNPRTSRFMVVWTQYSGGASVFARQFNADGSPANDAVNASPKSVPGGQGAPVVAYDWNRNLYCVVYTGDHPNVAGAIGAFGYLLDGNTGALASSLLVISLGYTIEPTIAYLPEADGFLASWTLVTTTRTSNARLIPSSAANGALTQPEYVAMSSNQQVGAPSLTYDYVSRRVLMASMRALDPAPGVIGGAVLDAFGTPLTATFNLSVAPPIGIGTLNPMVRAAESGIIGLSYISGYAAAQLERFAFPAAGTPGPSFDCGSNCTPPPPPPPPTDTDGDGVPDSQDSCPSVFAQTSNGCPVVPATVNGDFNADGKPELVYQNAGAPGQVYSWFLNSNLTFSSGAYLVNENVPPGWSVVGTSDFTGDGKPDVLYQNQTTGQLVLFVMNGTTKIGEQVLGASPAWRVVATGDFNGDGKTDLVWQNFAAGQIYFWFMTSSGGVATTMNPFQGAYLMDAGMNVITIGDKNWRVVGVADLNGDHKLDLIWQHSSGNLAAYYMNSTVATGAIDVSLNDPTWKVRAVGDYNLDGHPDLVFQNIVNGQIAAWLLTGSNGATLLGSANVGTVNLVWTLSGPK